MQTLKSPQGFTLLELLTVTAVIGALAAIAIPIYHKYTARAHVIEGVVMASSAKTAVSENSLHGMNFDSGWASPFPTSVVSTDPTGVSRLIASTGVAINNTNGEITITYTNKIAPGSPTLLLVPTDGASPLTSGQITQSGSVTWQCHSATPPIDNILRNRRGTIDPVFVPTECRG